MYLAIGTSTGTGTCNCGSLAWTAPAIESETIIIDDSISYVVNTPDPDTSATVTDSDFALCYENGGSCPVTGEYDETVFFFFDGTSSTPSGLPSWITFDYTSQLLTANPTDSALAGVTYTI
jgi:hypothetical protein